MPIQSYEEINSLLSGDVPALVYKEAADQVTEFGNLMTDLQTMVKVDPATLKKIVDRVSKYIEPDLSPNGFVVNTEKATAKWSWSTGRVNNNFPINLTAGQQVDAAVASQSTGGKGGDNEYAALLMTTTGRVATQITSPYLKRKLSNIPLSGNLMWGNSQLPGLMAASLLSLPTTTWSILIRDLSNTANVASPVTWGRQLTDSGPKRIEQVRRAMLFSSFMHPYLIGPLSGVYTAVQAGGVPGGPEILLNAGASVTLRYDTGGCDFLLYWLLDDSTQSDGQEPAMTAQILLGDAATPLMDLALPARDFVFAPTVAVAGMKQISGIAGLGAAQCPSPGSGWTMLIRRGTKFQIVLNNTNLATSGKNITIRNALGGIALYSPTDLAAAQQLQQGAVQVGR